MNKREFAKLLNGMREMLAHLRGEEVKGARLTAIPEPEVREVRQVPNAP